MNPVTGQVRGELPFNLHPCPEVPATAISQLIRFSREGAFLDL